MRKLIVSFVMFALLLAACSGAAGTPAETAILPQTGPGATAEAVQATPAQSTPDSLPDMPADSPTANATEAGTGGSEAGGVVVYRLVPAETTITYEVDETFLDDNRLNTAFGETDGVTGEIWVNFDNPQESSVNELTVDISRLTSDSARRDNALRERFLQSTQFPNATFTTTSIEGLPAKIEPGVAYPITLHGDLTIREVTSPVSFEATVTWQNDEISGEAETTFKMSDFGFGPISILGMLNTEDEVKITVSFVARPE